MPKERVFQVSPESNLLIGACNLNCKERVKQVTKNCSP